MNEEILEKIAQSSAGAHWKRVGISHHHGIDISLSALHSKNSCGIGEFFDLIPFIDWCSEINFDVIQLLPLNDSADDPSPYFAESACALNPLFLSLHALPDLTEPLKKKLHELVKLNKTKCVHYAEVQSHKFFWLNEYFETVGEKILNTKGYQIYKQDNPWVECYALFKAIKKDVSKNHWLTWPKELRNPNHKEYEALLITHEKSISFFIFLQYLCFLQLMEVKKYATSKKILLKGDIPILISPDSADVWQHPEYFDLSVSAGAPPDAYNEEGQVWGFPIFHWDAMKKDHYRWWKQRLFYASFFFDLYRIDHVLGFFRIWTIPLKHPSKDGKFQPADKKIWGPHGKALLEMLLENSPMLPIAEDLGVVPKIVRTILTELGICGTKVIRWERLWDEDERFISVHHYNPISMTTVSTHDSPTVELWWRDFPDEAKVYARFKHWSYDPQLTQEQRRKILWDSHHSTSLFHINLLQEYLALFPELVSENPENERINIPGKLLATNWTYRFRPSVEELISHKGLKQEISELLEGV